MQKEKWSNELKIQVAEKEKRKNIDENENMVYFQDSMTRLEKMNEAEAEKERRRIERAKEQNRIQEEQRKYKMKKKQAEADARR
jgi:hypothetical protein